MLVLAILGAAFAAVAATVASLHQTPNGPTHGAAAPPATHPTVPVDNVSHVATATTAADTATTTARTELHSMPGFPTVTKVAIIVNPYVGSLNRYASVLARARLPASARGAAANARALVTRDVQALGTINGLPSINLGTYLDAFGRNAAQLQTALATLRHQLGARRS